MDNITSSSSIYDVCVAVISATTTSSSTTDYLSQLLKCVADSQQQQQTSDLDTAVTSNNINYVDVWLMILCATLVYFMQTGFAMLCAGSVQAKNVKNVILWNLLDSAGGGIVFWAVGYAFAYGGDNSNDGGNDRVTFIGTSDFFVSTTSSPNVPLEDWFFQFAFACAVSSITAGAIAERCQMKAYLWFSTILVGFVYPVVAHNFWSLNGVLSTSATPQPLFGSGVIDLAGSGAVHMTGGVAALAGTLILGPRLGRFYDVDSGKPLDKPVEFTPHSSALQFLGVFCLWFGWYGFNGGSVLLLDNISSSTSTADIASLVVMNTTLGACAGAVSAMAFSSWWDLRYGADHHGEVHYDVVATMNGCLTGLVSITAGCATVETWAAVVIGSFAGIFFFVASKLLIRLRIDDAVDAIPVHMIGGMWGLISTGLFTTPDLREAAYGSSDHPGWFYDTSDLALLGSQIVGVLFVFTWTFVVMGLWFGLLNRLGWFRVDELEEHAGMDAGRHKGCAYDYSHNNQESIDELLQRREIIRRLESVSNDPSSRRGKRKITTSSTVATTVILDEPSSRRRPRRPDGQHQTGKQEVSSENTSKTPQGELDVVTNPTKSTTVSSVSGVEEDRHVQVDDDNDVVTA